MASGGARNRSGPSLNPNSGRSDSRGISLTALPSEGRKGHAPAFPLPKVQRWLTLAGEGGSKMRVPDKAASNDFRRRELQIWRDHWKMPQAVAWELEPWRWPTIAEFCRLKTVVELEPDANASLVAQLHRFRDQIGLTPAGLRENGWAIATDSLGVKRAEKEQTAPPAPRSSRDRMKVVTGDGR
ncbi:hypothetical protein [Nocardioides sp. ChNu-99]|uniref:hypothetical protein n=1 Tax=Nocardioides sp. ChNu-99 TaxID=2839897 RepID=UPI00240584B2|nr:hypothetical protein [Nocardioides sp. ChNu-99]MDF9718093.1 hypothetical protein [Nocardioides sp. ChNu-99]